MNSSYALFTDSIIGEKTIEATVKLKSLDTSGANEPVLDEGMIPVYYDENTETWKKASSSNSSKKYKWYDYDNKMWANSVTVSSTNRAKYLSAENGTEIPMDDILTMQVWIPRYKYKVWNYNSDGTKTSNEQEIEITFEDGTDKTGEISCTDSISGTDGSSSETCKLKSTNATCTDDICNNKTYTHPAFTFGDEEIKGFWIGKFEPGSTTGELETILTKPDIVSYLVDSGATAAIWQVETKVMKMNASGNEYGFSSTTDTHLIKNSEWGAVEYLSRSKYGTCTNGVCKDVNPNNDAEVYTGRSSGGMDDYYSYTSYKYNEIKKSDGTLIGAGQDGPSASTTHNVYGVYDMAGGADEITMANIISKDGKNMMAGNDEMSTSGYGGILYDSGNYTLYKDTAYPESKYYDKYSFNTNKSSKILSKLGDGIRENGLSGRVAYNESPWFTRGGYLGYGNLYITDNDSGIMDSRGTSRLIITP